MINSQPDDVGMFVADSISKGMGDQFSAYNANGYGEDQYIKGDG